MIHEVVHIAVLRCGLLERASVEGDPVILRLTEGFLVDATIVLGPSWSTNLAYDKFPRVCASERIEEHDAEDELSRRLRTSFNDPLELAEMSNYMPR